MAFLKVHVYQSRLKFCNKFPLTLINSGSFVVLVFFGSSWLICTAITSAEEGYILSGVSLSDRLSVPVNRITRKS